jgi:transcriptional regulator with XRE-family HTH domain
MCLLGLGDATAELRTYDSCSLDMNKEQDPTWLVNLREMVGVGHGRITEVAEAAGMKRQQLQAIVKGENLNPTVDVLDRLARTAGKTVDDLFARPREIVGHVGEHEGSTVLDRALLAAKSQPGTWQSDVADALAALARALGRELDREPDTQRPETSGR